MSVDLLLRFAFVAIGLLVFGAGMRNGSEALRWTGIALVSMAIVVRIITRIRRR